MKTNQFHNFIGNSEDFLKHCSMFSKELIDRARLLSSDVESLHLSHDESVELIVDESGLSRENANDILYQIHLEKVKDAINHLISLGYVQVSDVVNGVERYKLTKVGEDLIYNIKLTVDKI